MGEKNPLVLGLMLAVAVYVAWLWWIDYRNARDGTPSKAPLPGAVPATKRAVLVAAIGGLVLVAIETAGEYALGVSGKQSTITWLFALYTLAAAFVEELIFRGYVIVEKRGRGALVASAIGASVVFAMLHPFLWSWRDEGGAEWIGGVKGWFSTAMVFAASLWFYFVRFFALNPTRSLIPCFAAHAAKNAGVVAVKYAQGFVVGMW